MASCNFVRLMERLPVETCQQIFREALIDRQYPEVTSDLQRLCNVAQFRHTTWPLFLSANNFIARGSKMHWRWLKEHNLDTRNLLRRLTFYPNQPGNNGPDEGWNDECMLNMLSYCEHLDLRIIISMKHLRNSWDAGAWISMHGFAGVSAYRVTHVNTCLKHWRSMDSPTLAAEAGAECDRIIHRVLAHLRFPCPLYCKEHMWRPVLPLSQSTVFLNIVGCLACL